MKLYTSSGYGWSCYDEDTYSPCYDRDCSCHRSVGNIVGYGRTEEDAIIDFVIRLCEETGAIQ